MSLRIEPGPRAQAAALLALVGVLGVLIGIGIDRVLVGRALARPAPAPLEAVDAEPGGADRGGVLIPWMSGPPGRMRAMRFSQQMAEALGLTPQQVAAIDSIMEQNRVRVLTLAREYHPRFRAIVDETRREVDAVLTPEQRERLRAMQSGSRRALRGDGMPPGPRERRRGDRTAPDGASL